MKGAAAMLVAAALSAAVIVSARTAPAPQARPIGASDVADAVAIGLAGGAGASHADFHAPYVIQQNGPVVQSIEVVTEFRRVVLLAEEHARRGEAGWDARGASRALQPYRGRLDLLVSLRFDPQNTYRSVPDIGLRIYERDEEAASGIEPLHVVATPANFAGRVPPAGTPILGAGVEAAFSSASLDFRSTYLVGIFVAGREVDRAAIDLSRLR
jgi:hypothetical protein